MKKLLIAALVAILAINAWAIGSWWNSWHPLELDLVEQYRQQDLRPEGKVGVLFTGLMMPELLDDQPDLFLRIAQKPKRAWPWPFSRFVAGDYPTVLLDAERFHEREAFAPTRLVDAWGRERDDRGVSYMERYRAGGISWVPPRERLGSGHFLDEAARSEWPPFAQKPTVNARLWYYGVGLNPPRMPHAQGVRDVADMATETLRQRWPGIEVRQVNAPVSEQVRQGVFELLDSGVETLILASTQVSHSTFKVLGEGASFHQAWRYAEEWRRRNGGRPVKIIMAAPMGHYQPLLEAWTGLLRERLDELPAGIDVDVLVSSHGMPWDLFPDETYPEFAAPYYAGLRREIEAVLAGYEFGRTRVSQGQDIYADSQYDPEGKYTSTNEAYRAAAADGFDVVVTLPSTFYAESTDTLFAHALYAFEGLEGYEPFATIDYPDWSVPLVREFALGDTRIIYGGLPVGPHAQQVADALAASVEAILRPE